MIGGKNPNHRPPLVKKIEEPIGEDNCIDVDGIKEDFIALTKKEQVERLELFGLTKVEIRKLKREQDRVEKLMELVEEIK